VGSSGAWEGLLLFLGDEIAGDHADGQVKALSVELDVMERECILSQDHLEWSMLSMYCGVKHVV